MSMFHYKPNYPQPSVRYNTTFKELGRFPVSLMRLTIAFSLARYMDITRLAPTIDLAQYDHYNVRTTEDSTRSASHTL
jgi:hypothetical protein